MELPAITAIDVGDMQVMKRRRGQSLFELLAGLSVLIPALLVVLDLGIFIAASQTNSSICRDAARAAASGDPDQAKIRAMAIVESAVTALPGTSFRLLAPVQISITDRPVAQIDPVNGDIINPGGPVQGETMVSTEAEVKPIILGHIYGGMSSVKFRAQQICPLRFIEPANNATLNEKTNDIEG